MREDLGSRRWTQIETQRSVLAERKPCQHALKWIYFSPESRTYRCAESRFSACSNLLAATGVLKSPVKIS